MRLTATKNDSNSTVAITGDSDTSTPNTADFDLDLGANTLSLTVNGRGRYNRDVHNHRNAARHPAASSYGHIQLGSSRPMACQAVNSSASSSTAPPSGMLNPTTSRITTPSSKPELQPATPKSGSTAMALLPSGLHRRRRRQGQHPNQIHRFQHGSPHLLVGRTQGRRQLPGLLRRVLGPGGQTTRTGTRSVTPDQIALKPSTTPGQGATMTAPRLS